MLRFLVTFRPGCQTSGVTAVVWLLGMAAVLGQAHPRLHFAPYLVGMVVWTAAWVAVCTDRPRWTPWPVWMALGLFARLWALSDDPAFSSDVFRHVYEGQVVWSMGWRFPFVVPPAEAAAAGVSPELLGDAWRRINHPELATIYPPLAHGMFVLAGGLSLALGLDGVLAVKAVLVGIEVAGAAALTAALGPRWALPWWTCPLVITEVALEGHADGLAVAGYGVAVMGWARQRFGLTVAGFAVAAWAKLHGALGLIAVAASTRRLAAPAAVLTTLAIAVGLTQFSDEHDGLTAYATRWRANDGLFRLAWWGAGHVLGGEWAHAFGITWTRAGLARGAVGAAFVLVLALGVRNITWSKLTDRVSDWLVWVLLLGPTVHPWYALWLLPFVKRTESDVRWAAMAALAVAPLFHLPTAIEAQSGRWGEWAGVAIGAHVLIGAGWVTDRLRNHTAR